jgi:hypothetical protein
MSRGDDAAHADALRRLDESLEETRRLEGRCADARETPREPEAEEALAAGRAQVAAH